MLIPLRRLVLQAGEPRLARTSGDVVTAPRVAGRAAPELRRRRSSAAAINAVFGSARRLGAGALPLSRPAPARRAGRSAVRAADRGGRHRAHRALRAERLDRPLLAPLGIKVAYTPLGIVVALIFIGLPFVVRTVQPVLEDLDRERRGGRRQPGRDALADRFAA